MRNEQKKRKYDEDVKKEQVSDTNFNKTMTTWTIISTATQLICLDIEHVYHQRMRENLQTYIL